MSVWLCRDPELTDDQNRVATLREGSAGGWQRQPLGFPSMVSRQNQGELPCIP